MVNIRFYLGFLLLLTAVCTQANTLQNLQYIKPLKTNITYTKQAQKRFIAWDNLIKNNLDKPLSVKLNAVNNFFNALPYKGDRLNWGKKDYWAKPHEFIVVGKGDCEDYAIAKLYTLSKLGIPSSKFKFIYSKIKKEQKKHMVLAYYHNKKDEPFILDNINNRIFKANKRKDLVYLYAFHTNIAY